MDDEVKGSKGTSYTTMYRQLDPRIGRWLTIDPVTHAHQSPYSSMDNNPILKNDPLGLFGKNRAERIAKRARKRGLDASVIRGPLNAGKQSFWARVGVDKTNYGVSYVTKDGKYRTARFDGKGGKKIELGDSDLRKEQYANFDVQIDGHDYHNGQNYVSTYTNPKAYRVASSIKNEIDRQYRADRINGKFATVDPFWRDLGYGINELMFLVADAATMGGTRVSRGFQGFNKLRSAITLDRSIPFMFGDHRIIKAAKWISDYPGLDKGYTNIVMHGSKFKKFSFFKFNRMLNANQVTGNVRLWICEAGNNPRAMKLLAKRRGVNIQAIDAKIDVGEFYYEFQGLSHVKFTTFTK